jgi:RNA polymerase sigma factor (sigma-70 family)
MTTTEDLAQWFERDRRHLKSVAFHLLGSAVDAEDAVQSAWLKASHADHRSVENLTGWFTTITAREAVDQLRARKRRAEQPIVDVDQLDRMTAGPDEDVLLTESVSRAMLVVLDRLSPAQRIAFVLHDVFAMPFEAIGELLNRSPDAAKKLASRARGRLHAGGAQEPTQTAEHLEIVEAFLAASRGGDIGTLLKLLAPNVVRTVDRVLVPEDVATEIRGAQEVAGETRRFAARARAGVVLLVNGVPGIAIAPAGRLQALLHIGIVDGRIHSIDIVGDADRLESAVLGLPR